MRALKIAQRLVLPLRINDNIGVDLLLGQERFGAAKKKRSTENSNSMLWSQWLILVGLFALGLYIQHEQKKEWRKNHPGATDEEYYEYYLQHHRPEF